MEITRCILKGKFVALDQILGIMDNLDEHNHAFSGNSWNQPYLCFKAFRRQSFYDAYNGDTINGSCMKSFMSIFDLIW